MRPHSLPILLSRILVAIALVAQIVVAWHYSSLTWDDSAITLAFSRTFALTGRIEPTPGSGIVEGYSTTLWMLLMAFAAKFAPAPAAILAVAKTSTLLLNLANILLLRRWFLGWCGETCANLIAGSIGCGGLMFYETINGMETPLLLFLVLVMLLLLPRTSHPARLCYLLAGSAFLLTRWEAAWLLVPFVLVESSMRRALIASFTWLFVFIVSNLVRWHYFGYILPNTITAKSGLPYRDPGIGVWAELQLHLGEVSRILLSCWFMFLLLAACLVYHRFARTNFAVGPDGIGPSIRQLIGNSWQVRFTLLFTLFSFILTAAIGPNFGPPFRSFYCGWPFLFCLLLLPVSADIRSPALPWATLAICLFTLVRLFHQLTELNIARPPRYMPGTTVAAVAVMSSELSDIQSIAHHPQIVYAAPDMGGVMLYSNGITVVDLGLLCDARLAHERYAAINSYVLEQRQPDVIDVHDSWTKVTNFQAYPIFRSRYRPVYLHGGRLFLKRSLIADIDPSRLTEKSFTPAGVADGVEPMPARDSDLDHSVNQIFGTYLVLK